MTQIPFRNGFPDFSSVAVQTVKLERITGREADSIAANAAAGFTSTPKGFVWHHAESGESGIRSMTMQLVPEPLHRATGHTGPAAYARAVGGLLVDIATEPTTYMWLGIGTFLSVMAPSPANANESQLLQQLRSETEANALTSGRAAIDFGSSKLK